MLVWSGLIVAWTGYDGYVTTRYVGSAGFDPYPLILRNVLFLLQAACAAPVIPLSHNRTAERDRVKAIMTSTYTCWCCGRWRSGSPMSGACRRGRSCVVGSTFLLGKQA
jgi:hypothetical protein